MIRFFLLALFALFLFPGILLGKNAPLPTGLKSPPPLNILVISSFHLPHKWTTEVNSKLEFGIKRYTPYIEYLGLNAVRGRDRDYRHKFNGFVHSIQNKEFDVIVALLDDAINLVIENLDKIPKDVPIVFCGYWSENPEITKKHPNITGVKIGFTLPATLESALKILPNTEEILVVTDDLDTGLLAHNKMIEYARSFDQCKLTLINGKDHSTWEMLNKVNSLPKKSFVIFAPWRNYAKDGFSSLLEVGNAIYKSGHPYFVVTDVLFKFGALGGVICHGDHTGNILAELVTEVADKKSAVDVKKRFDSCQFSLDMREFNRLNLNKKLIPEGTILANKKQPMWVEYPRTFIAVIISFVFMILFAVLLAIYQRRISKLSVESNRKQLQFIKELTNHRINKEILQNGLMRILSEKEVPAAICEDMLMKFAKTIKADRIIFLKQVDDKHVLNIFEWCAEGISSNKEKFTLFSFESFPAIWETIVRRGYWEFEDINDLKNDEISLKVMEKYELKSAGIYAVIKDRKASGYIVVNFIKNPHKFTENDHVMLKSLAGIIALSKEWRDRKEEIAQKTDMLTLRVADEKLVNRLLYELVVREDVITDIDEVLQTLRLYLNCDRVYFGEYLKNGDFVINHQLVATGINPVDLSVNQPIRDQFLKWRKQFDKKDIVIIPEVQDSEYADIFANTGCKTVICSPIHVQDKLLGVFGIGFISGKWQNAKFDTDIMHSISAILSLIFQRNQRINNLKTTTSELKAVFDEIKIPMLLFNSNGDLVALNQSSHQLAGTDQADFLNTPCHKIICKSETRPPWCPVTQAMEKRETIQQEAVFCGRHYVLTATPILDATGRIHSVIEHATDVSEAVETRTHLENAIKAEQAVSKAKNYFLATVSHEIRTPLNSVIGFSELLRSNDLDPEVRNDYLKSISVASNSLLNLVNDILDFSKLENEQMPIMNNPCKLTDIFEEIAQLFKQRLEEKNIFLKTILPENLPVLMLDRSRIMQILINLVGNAVKYTNTGGVTITVDFKINDSKSGFFKMKVQDTGCGIPVEGIHHIFNPFYQTDVIRDAHTLKGTGLGLTITLRLVKAMGGTIKASSSVGVGSCFTIKLPSVEVFKDKVITKETNETKKTPNLVLNGSRKPLVLIVDDVPMNLKVLGAVLKKHGVETIEANDGEHALKLLETTNPDLVLTDMWMPGMNGAQLAMAIHEITEFKTLPIFAITADVEAQQNFDMSHFTGIIAKPITIDKIREII